jgi:creatinine amidohydrolase
MPIKAFSDMTWEEVEELDRARSVVILPVGAIEAHGPHLPLGTDNIIAEAMAREGAALLAAREVTVLILPTLTYCPADFASGFPGTVSVGADTATRVVTDIAGSLSRHGFRLLAIANAHLDPAHLAALRTAVQNAGDGLRVVFPDLTRREWARQLTEEFRSGACHAGRYEGSVVMAERPNLVRDEVRRTLPPNPASLSQAIREGKRTFEEAGGARAYFGWPAEASVGEGRDTVEGA